MADFPGAEFERGCQKLWNDSLVTLTLIKTSSRAPLFSLSRTPYKLSAGLVSGNLNVYLKPTMGNKNRLLSRRTLDRIVNELAVKCYVHDYQNCN